MLHKSDRQIVIPFHTRRAKNVAVIDNIEDMERLLGPIQTGDDLIAAGALIGEMLRNGHEHRQTAFPGGEVCQPPSRTRFVASP